VLPDVDCRSCDGPAEILTGTGEPDERQQGAAGSRSVPNTAAEAIGTRSAAALPAIAVVLVR
jgi:hypothetical protein